MMIIRTNLYREVLEARLEKERDPRRKFILAGIVLMALAVGNYLYLSSQVTQLRIATSNIELKAKAVQSTLDAARLRMKAQEAKVAHRDAVLKFAKQRLSWAPLLEKVFSTVPANVEISAISGSVGRDCNYSLRISGKTIAEQPRLETEKFRALLLDLVTDTKTEPEAEYLKLEDADAPSVLDGTAYPVATFVIQLQWRGAQNGN